MRTGTCGAPPRPRGPRPGKPRPLPQLTLEFQVQNVPRTLERLAVHGAGRPERAPAFGEAGAGKSLFRARLQGTWGPKEREGAFTFLVPSTGSSMPHHRACWEIPTPAKPSGSEQFTLFT